MEKKKSKDVQERLAFLQIKLYQSEKKLKTACNLNISKTEREVFN